MTAWLDVERRAFLIGAAKAGTTSLADWLSTSPDVCVSSPKEPLFFEADFDRGLEFYWSSYFAHWNGEPLVVDARHRNMYLPYVPARIALVEPNPLLVAIVREPVARSYAHWWAYHRGDPTGLGFEDAVKTDIARIRSGVNFNGPDGPTAWRESMHRQPGGLTSRSENFTTFVDSGYYAQQLERFISRFGSESLHVVFLEELQTDPGRELTLLADFLGVRADPIFPSSNTAAAAPNYRGGRLARRLIGAGAGRVLPVGVRRRVRSLVARDQIRPAIDPRTRDELIEHYRPHNAALERLLDRPLPPTWFA